MAIQQKVQELEKREDLEALLPGNIVEVKGGVTGEKIQYTFEEISNKEVSLLKPNGVININLRIPQKNFVIYDGCICYIDNASGEWISGDWWTKYYPGDKNYKRQRTIIEQSGV